MHTLCTPGSESLLISSGEAIDSRSHPEKYNQWLESFQP
jgi:hypothetical protein